MNVTLFDRFAERVPELAVPTQAATAPNPNTWIVNLELCEMLGIDLGWLNSAEGAMFLTGNGVEPDHPHPIAQKYSGHQFGGLSPLLGDGRALLLGSTDTQAGTTVDLHLKGSGPTPLSRGDGFATLEAALREFLMSEAMFALGIPTTRALAVTTTGRSIARDSFRHGGVLPGAVLARTAANHLRVGSFQYARLTREDDTLARLLEVALEQNDPDLVEGWGSDPHGVTLEFFTRVMRRQAKLVAEWMLVGFVHGVLNTDNVLVSGETIDYGPCAFLDAYDPAAVFSSIDHGGRYAYGAQPSVMKWNLARLADALLPMLGDDGVQQAEAALAEFDVEFNRVWIRGMQAKLGVTADVSELAKDLLDVMARERLDYTETFRNLKIAAADPATLLPELEAWSERWRALQPNPDIMRRSNPVTIPRNHHLQEAIDNAIDGDERPYTQLLEAVTLPYIENPEWAHLATSGAGGSAPFVSYCGT